MYLIKNANLLSMADINNEICDILLENGKIAKIGKIKASDHPKAIVIDANKNFVTPGLVDPHCHIGIYEEAIGFEGADGNEYSTPITPELRAIDAIKPQDVAFIESLEAGVTTVCTGPGSANLIGGTFCILKTYGKTIDDMMVVEESSMKMALGENPKRVYKAKGVSPTTRMASASMIREYLIRAKDYRERMDEYKKGIEANKDVKRPDYNAKLESLARVFDGLPVKIHAHQQDDIVTAMRIIQEFNLDATIEHASESHLITDYIKKYNQKLIIGPTMGAKTKYETRNKTFETARILKEAGIDFAIMTDHPVIHQSSTLTQVGLFIKEGLDFMDGLKSVTIDAARLNHIDQRVGSIEVGKDADIVIWDGDPFHYRTKTSYVFINGEIVHEKRGN